MNTGKFDAVQTGWSVHGRDGDKIGDIEEVGQDYLLVTKGLIFTTDLYIPTSAVGEVDATDGRVHLTVDKSEVENRGWTEPPMAETRDESSVEGLGYTGRDTEIADGDQVRVPLHEEQLRAERMTESAGEVRVGKRVHEEQRELDVPVTREEVEVRRVATDRAARADETAFSDGDTLRVPVTSERVEVTKEPRVVEEIEISKRPVTETQRVSDTVRREEVDVDESGNVLAGAGASMTGARRDLHDESISPTSPRSDDELFDDDATRRGER
jgi:uncharacterized protein (TIGR02271 family)